MTLLLLIVPDTVQTKHFLAALTLAAFGLLAAIARMVNQQCVQHERHGESTENVNLVIVNHTAVAESGDTQIVQDLVGGLCQISPSIAMQIVQQWLSGETFLTVLCVRR